MQASTLSLIDHSADRITRVAEAYRVGLRKPLPFRPRPDDPSMMLDPLPPEDQSRIMESRKFYGAAMKQARSGDLKLAMRYLQAAEKSLDFDAMERESICTALQLQLGVEAFIHYRNEELEAARHSLEEAIRLMNELQERFGYGFCDGRRVHLARNLLRLDAQGGEPVRAARAAFKLLLYTTGDDQAWPYLALQSKVKDRMMTEVERHMVFNQVARELVLMFLHTNASTHPALLAEGASFVQHLPDLSACDARIATTRQWLGTKRALLEDDGFLEQVAGFFRCGRSVPAFWYGVALDVAQVCERKGRPCAQALRQQIVDDVGTWKRLQRIDYSIIFRDA